MIFFKKKFIFGTYHLSVNILGKTKAQDLFCRWFFSSLAKHPKNLKIRKRQNYLATKKRLIIEVSDLRFEQVLSLTLNTSIFCIGLLIY